MQITEDLGLGGLEHVAATLCTTLDPDRFETSALCLKDGGPLADDLTARGIPVFRLPPPRGRADYFAATKIARILRRERIDVIHTHNTSPFIDGGLAALLAGTRTHVHTDHSRLFPDKRRYVIAEYVMSHFAYRVVGVSDHTVAELRRYERIPLSKLTTIPNGIDAHAFGRPRDATLKRLELGIAPTSAIIGVAVRLTEQKGLTYLLQAMPDILAARPDTVLVIAGDGILADALRDEARALCVEEHVRFIGPRRDIPELLAMFDLYALPSEWEGLPMIILEAMASGCPIVATDVGGVRTAVRDGENGFLVPARDVGALARRIVTLLGDTRRRREFGEAGRKLFRERFSAEAMAAAYARLYTREATG
jgi:glycosyltransferase involved in cell wall biosynthesis